MIHTPLYRELKIEQEYAPTQNTRRELGCSGRGSGSRYISDSRSVTLAKIQISKVMNEIGSCIDALNI